MPFAGYKTFQACIRDHANDPKIYSPGGLCHAIEQNASRGRKKRLNPAVIAELIQLTRTKTGWHAIEYVDVDDQAKIGNRIFAPGIRLILKGKTKGPFSVGYAVFRRIKGGRWKWLHSTRYLQGKFDFERETLTVPNHLNRAEKTLAQAADMLLTWVVQERQEHGS